MAAAKVSVAAARMAQGNLSNVEWFRGIGEYKIDWRPGVRLRRAGGGGGGAARLCRRRLCPSTGFVPVRLLWSGVSWEGQA